MNNITKFLIMITMAINTSVAVAFLWIIWLINGTEPDAGYRVICTICIFTTIMLVVTYNELKKGIISRFIWKCEKYYGIMKKNREDRRRNKDAYELFDLRKMWSKDRRRGL